MNDEGGCDFWMCRRFGHLGLMAPEFDQPAPTHIGNTIITFMCGRTGLPITRPLDVQRKNAPAQPSA